MSNTWLKECSRRGLVLAVIFLSAWVGCTDPLETVRELQTQGRYDESLEPLRELVSSRPDDPEVMLNVGSTYYRMNNHEEATKAFSQAYLRGDDSIRHVVVI